MKFKRFWTMFLARNREFFRDRAAFGWNFLFPFLLVAGFGVIFGGRAYSVYKIGIFPYESKTVSIENANLFGQIEEQAQRLEMQVEERTRELSLSEARYRSLVESAQSGIFQLDLEGRFLYGNQEVCRI